MKKWIVSLAMLMSTMLFSQESTTTLAAKISLKSGASYFILTDASLWKAVPYVQRWRGPIEWFNDVKLIPETYTGMPKEWVIGSNVEVFERSKMINLDEKDAQNQEELQACTHLIMNAHTGKILFAKPFDLMTGAMQLFEEIEKEGYLRGYDAGYNLGYTVGKSSGSQIRTY